MDFLFSMGSVVYDGWQKCAEEKGVHDMCIDGRRKNDILNIQQSGIP